MSNSRRKLDEMCPKTPTAVLNTRLYTYPFRAGSLTDMLKQCLSRQVAAYRDISVSRGIARHLVTRSYRCQTGSTIL